MSGKRSIFEEVEPGAAPRPAPAPGLIDAPRRGARGAVRAWLMALFALVVVMIAVGGLTRLTDSGLSITEWDPVMGALPPLSEPAWQEAFEKYQATDEFRLQNSAMSLAEFRGIFWWEWAHRQLGRAIGLVWAAGFAWFWLRGQIPAGWTGRLLLPGALGGLQGAVGWWMVSSGLKPGMLDVASYRLAIHLGLAFAILGLLAWYAMLLGRSEAELLRARRDRERRLFGLGTGLMHFTFLQVLLGALVAGIDAGRNYVDWPLMAGGVFPPEMWAFSPWWRNFFENDGTVQFVHRLAGYLLVIFALVAWRRARGSGRRALRRAFDAAAAMCVLQAGIGVVTVMNAAPLALGLLHQLGAVALWVLVLRARFLAGYPPVQSVRGT